MTQPRRPRLSSGRSGAFDSATSTSPFGSTYSQRGWSSPRREAAHHRAARRQRRAVYRPAARRRDVDRRDQRALRRRQARLGSDALGFRAAGEVATTDEHEEAGRGGSERCEALEHRPAKLAARRSRVGTRGHRGSADRKFIASLCRRAPEQGPGAPQDVPPIPRHGVTGSALGSFTRRGVTRVRPRQRISHAKPRNDSAIQQNSCMPQCSTP